MYIYYLDKPKMLPKIEHQPLQLSPEKTLRNCAIGAKQLAASANNYLPTRGIWNIIDDIYEMPIPNETKDLSAYLLTLPNLIKNLPNHKERASIDILLATNEHLGLFMQSELSKHITPIQFTNYCLRYCTENAMLFSGEDRKNLEKDIYAEIFGIRHELNWLNLISSTGTFVEHSSPSEDLGGIDMFVKLDNGLFAGIDVKASELATKLHANKLEFNTSDHSFSFTHNKTHGIDSFKTKLMVDSSGNKIYVVMENPPASEGMHPIDFGSRSNEINCASKMLNKLNSLGPDGEDLLVVYDRTSNNSGRIIHTPVKRHPK
jgi:hypothetical protein